jgi:hypothetical protein
MITGNGRCSITILQKREAVHARHLEVEREHVGVEFLDLVAGGVGVDRGADDFDVGIGFERIAHEFADDGGVVHDQDADRAGGHGVTCRAVFGKWPDESCAVGA